MVHMVKGRKYSAYTATVQATLMPAPESQRWSLRPTLFTPPLSTHWQTAHHSNYIISFIINTSSVGRIFLLIGTRDVLKRREVKTGYRGNKNINGKGLLPIKRVDGAGARLYIAWPRAIVIDCTCMYGIIAIQIKNNMAADIQVY